MWLSWYIKCHHRPTNHGTFSLHHCLFPAFLAPWFLWRSKVVIATKTDLMDRPGCIPVEQAWSVCTGFTASQLHRTTLCARQGHQFCSERGLEFEAYHLVRKMTKSKEPPWIKCWILHYFMILVIHSNSFLIFPLPRLFETCSSKGVVDAPHAPQFQQSRFPFKPWRGWLLSLKVPLPSRALLSEIWTAGSFSCSQSHGCLWRFCDFIPKGWFGSKDRFKSDHVSNRYSKAYTLVRFMRDFRQESENRSWRISTERFAPVYHHKLQRTPAQIRLVKFYTHIHVCNCHWCGHKEQGAMARTIRKQPACSELMYIESPSTESPVCTVRKGFNPLGGTEKHTAFSMLLAHTSAI